MDNAHQKLNSLIRRCTARLHTDIVDQKIIGTGFFVAPELILTCAHIVETASPDSSAIRVRWKGQIYNTEILHLAPSPYPDLALLKVSLSHHPCVYLDDSIELKDELYSYGYSLGFPKGDSVLFVYEGPSDGGLAEMPQPLLKLKAGQASPGMSGAPLLNLRTGAVCGILKKSRDIYSDLGGRAIPMSAVFSTFSELASLNQEFHNHNKFWVNSISSIRDVRSKRRTELNFKTKLGLEAIGYTVSENVSLAGCQIDLYAQLISPLFTHRIIVECKTDSAQIDVDTIRKFASLVDTFSNTRPGVGLLTYEGLAAVLNKEVPFFEKLSQERKIKLFKLRALDPQSKYPELGEFKEFWNNAFQVAHLACHAYYEAGSSKYTRITLSDEFDISLFDMENCDFAIDGHPLVIMNACETGNLNPLYTGNFAREFLRYGAGGVVATECAIPDDFAADFAEQLYTRLLAGEPLGESLLVTRRYFLEKHNNPLGLLYSMYASPTIRLARQEA
jgi:hypothetical protein